MRLFYEIWKNLKIIFRNASSLSMLVLGPLILILLIGFAFSGDDLHGIRLGVYSPSYGSIQVLLDNMTGFGQIVKFSSADDCIVDLTQEKVHICLEFSRDFIVQSDGEIPTGEITYHYDNTRQKITNIVVDAVNQYLGVAAEQISIQSATTIFENIQTMVIFLEDKREDILVLRDESLELRAKMVERKDRLEYMYSVFEPRYNRIKELQKGMDEDYALLESSYLVVRRNKEHVLAAFDEYHDDLDFITSLFSVYDYYVFDVNGTYSITTDNNGIGPYYNLSDIEYEITEDMLVINQPNQFNQTVQINISDMEYEQYIVLKLQDAQQNLDDYKLTVENYDTVVASLYADMQTVKGEIDETAKDLDVVNSLLVEEINMTEAFIVTIDVGVVKIDEVTTELDEGLDKLEFISPELAEKLVNPILKFFEPVKKEIKSINLIFPLLLSVVIVFISLLFSNIVTQQEIHSTAFFRNLIAPVNDLLYTTGLILTSFIVVLFQVFILLLVAQYQFKIDVFANIWPILGVSVIMIAIFIFIGMLIAYVFRNQQTSVLTTTFFALAVFLFSNVVTPLESMPELATILASYNPLVISSFLFKQIIIYDTPLILLMKPLNILTTYLAVILVVLLLVSKSKNKA